MQNQKMHALAAIAVSNVLVMLALVPVTNVLPTIATQFSVDVPTAGWVMTAFLLSLTASLLIAGRLGDLYGYREVFLAGAMLYTIAGTLCAFAQQIELLIVLRMFQGLGAAMISGNSLAIIAHTFTERERGRAIGIAAASAALGSIGGVLGSAYLAENLHWQWLFLINLPIGAASVGSAWKLQSQPFKEGRSNVDVGGALLLASALGCLSLALSHAHSGEASFGTGWAYHGTMLSLTAFFVLLFVVVELRAVSPIVDLRYLRNGLFSWSVIANATMHLTMMASLFLMPFLTASGRGFTQMETAVVLLAGLVGNVPTPPLSGIIYDRTRWRLLSPLSLGAIGVLLLTMAFSASTVSFFGLVALSFSVGVASGFFQTPNNTIIMGTVPAELRGFAAGMIETSRQLGHTIGIGVAGSIMGGVLAGAHQIHGDDYVAGYQQAIGSISGLAFVGVAAALIAAYRQPSKVVPRELVEVI